MVIIYGHPLASFYWKALVALYERGVPFEFRMVDPAHPENAAAVARAAPTGQFPVLVDGDRTVIESAAIIEYLDLHHGDALPMVPADPKAAIEARQMDSVFDDYVMSPLTKMVVDRMREPDRRDPQAVAEAKSVLDRSYAWLDRWMDGRVWAAGETFGLADIAAASALFYAHWGYAIPKEYERLRAYRARLLARPSVARVVDEAKPWFQYFPLKDDGSPD